VQAYHQWVYLGLGVCCAVMAVYSRAKVPETQGVPLERMTQLFLRKFEGVNDADEEQQAGD